MHTPLSKSFRIRFRPMIRFRTYCFTLILLLTASLGAMLLDAAPAYAFEKLEGRSLLAERACPALQSIKKKTNPDNVTLEPGRTYQVRGQNKRKASHYQVQISGARPENRWVGVNCGQLQRTDAVTSPVTEVPSGPTEPTQPKPTQPKPTQPEPDPISPAPVEPSTPPDSDSSNLQTSRDEDFLLALSWQPSFCETRPNKPECQSQTSDRFDATHLVLHGLWPQPRENVYCGVSDRLIKLDKARRWSKLPALDLSPETRQALKTKMPGMASGLDRHEWYKHGTCYSNTAEEYYQESIALLDQVNASGVQELLASNINFLLTDTEIKQEFDGAFGRGSGEKVAMKCKRDIDEGREIMMVELWLNLKGKIEQNTAIAHLIQAAPRARRDCRQGEIDPAGFGNG